ncbi:MAG TPA: EamA family transporter [Azospira sp.]|nr:EamA family transporter [Azospira sp.]
MPVPDRRQIVLATLLTTLAPVIWGSTYVITSELLPPDRPFHAALLRVLPAGLLLLAATRLLPARGEWWRLAVLGTLNIGAFQALLFVAAYRLPGGLAAVLGATQPVLVMALVWLAERRRPPALALGAAAVGIAGMAAMLLGPDSRWDALGAGAALLGAACMAAGTWLGSRWPSGLPVLALTGWQLSIGGLVLLPLALALEAPLPPLSPNAIAGYAYLSLFGALLTYLLWFRGLARLSPVAVSSLALLSPLTAVVLGWALLGQSMRGLSLAGLVAVLGSVLAIQWATTGKATSAR